MYALPLGAVGAVVSAGISRENATVVKGGKKTHEMIASLFTCEMSTSGRDGGGDTT